ncbi:MAG: site-specific integrase [Burkholderiaceae bacterium]|nr:MAG: site-specific integrase [Burkholderiaceae bacterium]
MSKIRLRPDTKRLYFDFVYRGVRCREYSALSDTKSNRRKMEDVLTRIESQIANGTFDYAQAFPGSARASRFARTASQMRGDPITGVRAPKGENKSDVPLFADFARTWMQEKQVEWRIGHRESMQSILETHLLPRFGSLRLDAIGRADVLQFRSTLVNARGGHVDSDGKAKGKRVPLAPATLNRIVGTVRMIFAEAALRFGITDPCLGIKRLKVPRQDIQPFTMEEVRLILARVRKDYRPYLTFRFFTGVRSAEAHGLKWKHVDFDARELLIRETYQHGRTEYTKTDGSQREIHMSQPVVDALMSMRPAGYAADAKRFDDTYVFRTKGGHPIDNSNFVDRVWTPLLRSLGLAYRRPYDMRHTCATLWLAAGEAPEWIARQLGHTTTEMLFRTYSRYVPNMLRHDGSAFDRLVVGALAGNAAAGAPAVQGATQTQQYLQPETTP